MNDHYSSMPKFYKRIFDTTRFIRDDDFQNSFIHLPVCCGKPENYNNKLNIYESNILLFIMVASLKQLNNVIVMNFVS